MRLMFVDTSIFLCMIGMKRDLGNIAWKPCIWFFFFFFISLFTIFLASPYFPCSPGERPALHAQSFSKERLGRQGGAPGWTWMDGVVDPYRDILGHFRFWAGRVFFFYEDMGILDGMCVTWCF